MKKWIPLLLAAFVLCPYMDVAAQGVIYQNVALDSEGRTLKNTTIRVCDEPAISSPCTPLSTIFSDKALGSGKVNPFTADSGGVYFFYAAPGLYHVEVTSGSTILSSSNIVLIDEVLSGGGTTGSVLFVGSSGEITEDNPNLFWNDTLNRLGVGNAIPAVPLDVTGAITASGTITGGAVSTAGIVTGADFTWTGATATVIPFIGASGVFTEDPTGLCFDSGNDRIGIGVCPPTVALHVIGTAIFDNNVDTEMVVEFISGDTGPENIKLQFGTFGDSNIGTLEFSSAATILRSITDIAILQANASALFIRPTGNNDCIILEESVGGNDLMTVCDVGTTGDVTVTGDVQVDGFVDSITGFQHNSLAPSGNVLRGDGTNFISAALAATDLSEISTSNTDDSVWVGSGSAMVEEALPDCSTAVIDSVTYSTSTNAFGCNTQVVTDHTILIGTGTSRTASAALADCDAVGDAVTYDQTGHDFACARLQQGWRAGVFEEAPATTGTQDDVPLPVPNYCATNITVDRVVISARDDGSTNTTYNVIRFNSSGASQGNIFSGTQTFTGGGGNYQTDTVTTTTATATDYFLMDVISVGDSAGLTFIVEGKCDAL